MLRKKKKSPVAKLGKVFLILILILLILILLLAGAALGFPYLEHNIGSDTAEGSADWMADIPDEIPLELMNIPGTHDSAAQYVQLGLVTKCQDSSIKEQLEAGYRYLDIRLQEVDRNGQAAMIFCHGFTHCKRSGLPLSDDLYLEEVLQQCYQFLEEHPSETIIFNVKQEYGDASVTEFENTLDSYVQADLGKWYLGCSLPTLGEARGKIVLCRRYEDEADLGEAAGVALIWKDQGGSGLVDSYYTYEPNATTAVCVQDRYEYDVENKWNTFAQALAHSPEALGADTPTIMLNFLSTKGSLIYGNPWYFARQLDRQFLYGEKSWDEIAEANMGWVIVDFGSAEMAQRIYLTNE